MNESMGQAQVAATLNEVLQILRDMATTPLPQGASDATGEKDFAALVKSLGAVPVDGGEELPTTAGEQEPPSGAEVAMEALLRWAKRLSTATIPDDVSAGDWADRIAADVAAAPEAGDYRPQLLPEATPSGIMKIDTNDGSGTYTATEQVSTGSSLQAVGSTHPRYQITVRDVQNRLSGVTNDYVIFWQVVNTSSTVETLIDLTTTALWCDVTSIAALPVSVDGQQSPGPTQEGSGPTITVYLFASQTGGADTWIQPSVAVDDKIPYFTTGGTNHAVGIKWKHAGPDASDMVSLDSCTAAYKKYDKRGHLAQYSSDDITYYDLEGSPV